MDEQPIHSVQYKNFTITPDSRGIGYQAVSNEDPAIKCFSLTWTDTIKTVHAMLWPVIEPVDVVHVNLLAETFKGISRHIDYDLNNNKREY